MIDGDTTISGTPQELAANTMILSGDLALSETRYLVRIVAYLDGLGSATAPQLVRGVLYSAENLVAAGDVIAIQDGQSAAWVPLTFTGLDGLALKPGDYQFGVHAGQTSDSARVLVGTGATPDAELYTSESFTAGPSASIGAPSSTLAGPIVAYLETLKAFNVPVDQVDDDYLATLPFALTQRVFTQTAPLPKTIQLATAGWYGSNFDETQGSNAIVNANGPLTALVGERLQIAPAKPGSNRSIVVYVHDMAEFPDELASEDLMLSQRSFLQIANWADDELQVHIEVMA